MQAFEKGETGLRANCLPNILEQELLRNPFDGFFYPLNHHSIGVLIGSTRVKFRATLQPKIYIWNDVIFLIVIFHSRQKSFRNHLSRLYKLKPTQCSCVLAGCMILMFSKSLNSQCFYHTRRCPKNWPPLYTFKSSTVGSQTMQPFSCCIIEQITLETSKKCINNFVFCSVLSSKDGVRCYATLLLVFSHLGNTATRCMLY